MADPLVTSPTSRGFLNTEFLDRYSQKCSLQKSSLAGVDCIWLGVNINIEGQTVMERMHLTQEHVRALLPALQYFVDTGQLPPPGDPALPLERMRHVKRGETVTILGDAEVQISNPSYVIRSVSQENSCTINTRVLHEGESLTVYRAEGTGKLWARFPDEFRDGRFTSCKDDEDE